MEFCIRDDDTSFFTRPEELEGAYGSVSQGGPISLAVVPFHVAGVSKGVPDKFRGRWSVHPLHENLALVDYLRAGVARGSFEIMLHGYHHDERSGQGEFKAGDDLERKVLEARKYLEDLLGTQIRVFIPPNNAIGSRGIRAVTLAGLHLGGTAGVRSGWPLLSYKTWYLWCRLRLWNQTGTLGIPWVLDLGNHREIPGNPVTPSSSLHRNEAVFDSALAVGGIFCAATHYWELDARSDHCGEPTVREHLQRLVERARSDQRVVWRSVGEIVSNSTFII